MNDRPKARENGTSGGKQDRGRDHGNQPDDGHHAPYSSGYRFAYLSNTTAASCQPTTATATRAAKWAGMKPIIERSGRRAFPHAGRTANSRTTNTAAAWARNVVLQTTDSRMPTDPAAGTRPRPWARNPGNHVHPSENSSANPPIAAVVPEA